jgi:hypothetical protein|uniref:hypothetical protein n=2 Tax=Cephaloticoccus sp. TaxID=1985742 RepID=UPI00404ABD41
METSDRMRGYFVASIALAGTMGLNWLWINFCLFPASSWNDIRLVPVFMAAAGEAVYTLPGQGVISTWMYGPVPLWFWSPALLGNSPIGALMISECVNLGLTLGSIALTCAYWPCRGATRTLRLTAFIATVALWPDHAFRFLQADNIAVSLGLMGNLLLVSSTGRPQGWKAWLTALATVGAMGCKQNTLGLLLAQLIWLRLAYDSKPMLAHLGRTVVCGLFVATIAIMQFGFSALWFGMVEIAAALPMADEQLARLTALATVLVIQWGVPLMVIGSMGRKIFRSSHSLSLPIFAWIGNLPLGIFGLLTTGGSTNNLHGWQLLIASLLLGAVVGLSGSKAYLYRSLTMLGVFVVFCGRILQTENAPFHPDTQNIHQAMAIQASMPHQVWLPWNPLVSWFSDRRFYHAEDGLYVRFISGQTISVTQARNHLPRNFHAMAFPSPEMQWGVAAKLAPPDHAIRRLGNWEILIWDFDRP